MELTDNVGISCERRVGPTIIEKTILSSVNVDTFADVRIVFLLVKCLRNI